MIQATQLKRGMCIKHDNDLYRVVEAQHKTPGNLRGLVQAKIRNLKNGAISEHRFRSVDKDAIQVLPPELQPSIVGNIWQDEVSALFPAAGVVASPLLRAAGVPTLEPRLFVMPDNPALGEFRTAFAGMLGILEEWPRPPYDHAREILGTEDAESAVGAAHGGRAAVAVDDDVRPWSRGRERQREQQRDDPRAPALAAQDQPQETGDRHEQ